VAFLPSDHYIPNAAPLLQALRAPTAERVALIGVAPTAPEMEYGWIVPGRRLRASARREVARFVEKRLRTSPRACSRVARCGTRSSRSAR